MTRKFDLVPGTEYDALIVGIACLAIGFVASQGWKEDAWMKAASTTGPAGAALLWSKTKEQKEAEEAHKRGWEEGYNTFNPELHVDELIEKRQSPAATIGKAVARKAAETAIDVAADQALDQVQSWFEDPDRKKR